VLASLVIPAGQTAAGPLSPRDPLSPGEGAVLRLFVDRTAAYVIRGLGTFCYPVAGLVLTSAEDAEPSSRRLRGDPQPRGNP